MTTTSRIEIPPIPSLVALGISLLIAFVGYRALQAAAHDRSVSAALAEDPVCVTGQIVEHVLHTDQSQQRRSWYLPVVAFRVDGRDYRVTAMRGTGLAETNGVHKVGAAIDVVFPRGMPDAARVVGLDDMSDTGLGLMLIGAGLIVVPLGGIVWGTWRRRLFVRRR